MEVGMNEKEVETENTLKTISPEQLKRWSWLIVLNKFKTYLESIAPVYVDAKVNPNLTTEVAISLVRGTGECSSVSMPIVYLHFVPTERSFELTKVG